MIDPSIFIPADCVRYGNFYNCDPGTFVLPQYGGAGELAVLAQQDEAKFLIFLGGSGRGKGYPLRADERENIGQYFLNTAIEVDVLSLSSQFAQGALIRRQGAFAMTYEGGGMGFTYTAFLETPTKDDSFSRQMAYDRWRVVLQLTNREIELYRYDAAAQASDSAGAGR